MKIYVFGNIFVQGDDAVFSLTQKLEKMFPAVLFQNADPNENFPPPGERDPILLDAVKGINTVTLLKFGDLVQIQKSPVSPHDYDLLLHLTLLKKMEKLDTITIIGIPFGKEDEKILEDTSEIISSLLSGNVKRKTYRGQTP